MNVDMSSVYGNISELLGTLLPFRNLVEVIRICSNSVVSVIQTGLAL